MKNKKKQKLSHTDIIFSRWHMKKAGIEPYNKRSIVRTSLGVALIGTGLVTFFVPFTTIPLCMAGAVMIGYDLKA